MSGWRSIVGTIVLAFGVLASPSPVLAEKLDDMHGTALTEAKTRAEIRSLRSAGGTDYTAIAAVITAGVAAAGVLLTLRKQITESADLRRADQKAQAEMVERRFEEQFTSLVSSLGGEQPATRAGAAVGVLRFLAPTFSGFHADVTRLLVAQLKVQSDSTTLSVLRDGFETAVDLGLLTPQHRDLSGAKLNHVRIAGADLAALNLSDAQARFGDFSKAKLHRLAARRADLEKATFVGASLREARCREANLEGTDFSNATLTSANFKESNLRNAKFYGAKLQGAQFRGANLSGTRFEGANVADAHFSGAAIAPETYRSLARALNWRKAHFDTADRDEIERQA